VPLEPKKSQLLAGMSGDLMGLSEALLKALALALAWPVFAQLSAYRNKMACLLRGSSPCFQNCRLEKSKEIQKEM
jgi:hypothetical protein